MGINFINKFKSEKLSLVECIDVFFLKAVKTIITIKDIKEKSCRLSKTLKLFRVLTNSRTKKSFCSYLKTFLQKRDQLNLILPATKCSKNPDKKALPALKNFIVEFENFRPKNKLILINFFGNFCILTNFIIFYDTWKIN